MRCEAAESLPSFAVWSRQPGQGLLASLGRSEPQRGQTTVLLVSVIGATEGVAQQSETDRRALAAITIYKEFEWL
jgi:hypothetical protein